MNVSFASPGWLSIGVLAVVSFFLLALRAERLRRRAIAVLHDPTWTPGAEPATPAATA